MPNLKLCLPLYEYVRLWCYFLHVKQKHHWSGQRHDGGRKHACLIRMEVERMLDPDGGRKNGWSGWRWKACLIRMEVESMLDPDGGGKHAWSGWRWKLCLIRMATWWENMLSRMAGRGFIKLFQGNYFLRPEIERVYMYFTYSVHTSPSYFIFILLII